MKHIIVLAILVLMISASTAYTQPLCGALLEHRELADEIGVTEGQRVELEDLYEATERQMIDSHAQMEIKRLELERLMRSDDPDMRQIRKLVSESADARSSAMLARIERGVGTRKILTDDQLKKAREVMRERSVAMKGHRGEGRMGREGREGRGFRGDRQGPGENRGPRGHRGPDESGRPSF